MATLIKQRLANLKGKETLVLITLNVFVIAGLVLFYVFVLRNNFPGEEDVLGSSSCKGVLLSGKVFNDKNGNGINNNEPGIKTVTVKIKMSGGQEFTVKNPGGSDSNASNDGDYEVCVPKDQYARVEFLDLPGGYYPGPHGADSGTAVNFVSTAQNAKASFGVLIAGSGDPSILEIGNRIWNDLNSNGVQDPGEPGVSGVKVSLKDYYNSSTVIAETQTDANGNYYFTNGQSGASLESGRTYLITVSSSVFEKGGKLEGYTTTKARVGDPALDSDPNGSEKSVKIPVVVGVGSCSLCLHNYDIGVTQIKAPATPSSTPIPTPVYVEPSYPQCASGTEQMDQYSAQLRRDISSETSRTYTFNLDASKSITFKGFAKEGHPELYCPNPSNSICNDTQDNESFKVTVDGKEIGRYTDKGKDVNAWSEIGPWTTEVLSAGQHTIKFEHLMLGSGPQSVDYKVTSCLSKTVSTPTATNTPSPIPTTTIIITPVQITATSTPEPTVTDTPEPTVTATPEPTSTAVPTQPATTTTPVGGQTVTPTPTGEVEGVAISPTPSVLPNTGVGDVWNIALGIILVLSSGVFIYKYRKGHKIKLSRVR